MEFTQFGALCFGLVIGWVTYRTLRRTSSATALTDLATVIGAVGGGVVTKLYGDAAHFAAYAIGLAIGFFVYFIVSLGISGKTDAAKWMGD